MREKYLSLSLGTLKELAKARGMKGISTLKKSELIERMLQEDEKEKKIEKETKVLLWKIYGKHIKKIILTLLIFHGIQL